MNFQNYFCFLPQPCDETNVHVIDPEQIVRVPHQLNDGVGHEEIEHHRLSLHPGDNILIKIFKIFLFLAFLLLQ